MAHKLTLLAILLNSGDTFFTSLALDLGAFEANPIVAAVLTLGMTWFLFYKLIIINFMIVFVGSIGYNYRMGRIGLGVAACVYSLLIFYHMGSLSILFLTGNVH